MRDHGGGQPQKTPGQRQEVPPSPREQWAQPLGMRDPGTCEDRPSSQPKSRASLATANGQDLLTAHSPALPGTQSYPPHSTLLGLDTGPWLHLPVAQTHVYNVHTFPHRAVPAPCTDTVLPTFMGQGTHLHAFTTRTSEFLQCTFYFK